MELETVKVNLPSKRYDITWGGINFHIENVEGNLNVVIESDVNIGINGEFGMATTNNIHFDTINSKIFLNSRNSKLLKNLPESIEYKEKMEKETKQKQFMFASEHEKLIDKIDNLEKKINNYENTIDQLLKTVKKFEEFFKKENI